MLSLTSLKTLNFKLLKDNAQVYNNKQGNQVLLKLFMVFFFLTGVYVYQRIYGISDFKVISNLKYTI